MLRRVEEEPHRLACRCSCDPDEVLDGIEATLGCGAQDGHDPALGLRPPPGPAAAPDLAVDDRGADRLLTSPVRRLDVVDVESYDEHKHRATLLAERYFGERCLG